MNQRLCLECNRAKVYQIRDYCQWHKNKAKTIYFLPFAIPLTPGTIGLLKKKKGCNKNNNELIIIIIIINEDIF